MSPKPSKAERLRRWFFPPEVELPEHARRVLRTVYPTLDLKALRFHLGIPHVFNLFAIQGITLPGKLRPRSRIYIEPEFWDPGSLDGLGLLLHESYHALQIQEAGFGLGLLRPFMVLYLACAAGNRFQYAGHPMEDDAYRVAGDAGSLFESTFRNRAEIPPEACECVATPSSGLSFWRRLAESTPGWRRAGASLRILLLPWVALWFLFWTSAVAILAGLKGLVEILGALAVGALSLGSVRSIQPRN